MKLHHIQRFNRGNMDAFVFLTPFYLFSSVCTNMTTWCLYNTFKSHIVYMFIHPSTQLTKILSYSISRDLIGEIWSLLYFWYPFLLIFSSFCTNMTTWCPYNTFKYQIRQIFIHPSTQPTKIWSYSISRDLMGKYGEFCIFVMT